MKKSLRKILLIISTVVLSVVLAACGSKGESNNNSNSNSNSESTASKPLTSQEIIDKYAEVTKNIKSTKFDLKINMDVKSGDESMKLSLAMDGAVSTDPIAMLMNYKETADDESREASLYVKDENTFYAKNGSSGKWQKQSTTDSMKKQLESMKQIAATDKSVDFYKNNASDFKVEEQGDKYVLTYTGNDSKFIDLIKQNSGTAENAKGFDDVEFTKISVKFSVKKSSFEPVDLYITADFHQKDKSSNTASMEMTNTYSEINSVKITAPQGIE